MTIAPLHLLAVENGIAVVTLNRPEALNSLNHALRLELMGLFPALDQRKDVKVIVITGAGDKAFCTGADLKERSARTTGEMIDERYQLTGKTHVLLANISHGDGAADRLAPGDRCDPGEARAQPGDGNPARGRAALRPRSMASLHALGRVEGKAGRLRTQGAEVLVQMY